MCPPPQDIHLTAHLHFNRVFIPNLFGSVEMDPCVFSRLVWFISAGVKAANQTLAWTKQLD